MPTYAVAALWLLRALTGNLYSTGQIIGTIALSFGVFLVAKMFFPNKVTEAEEQPKREPAPPKQAADKQEPPRQEPAGQKQTQSTGNAELDQVLQEGQQSIAEIQTLNDAIPDYKVSAQIKQLEVLTDKIFGYIRQHPENLGQIRQFLDYYLPTTIKLLKQYVELQDQGMSG